MSAFKDRIQYAFVKLVYADHNRSENVQQALAKCLMQMPKNGSGLNVGSCETRIDSRLCNLDIRSGPNVDCVAQAEELPFRDCSVDLVVTQETLEHVRNPFQAMGEIQRVLKPGGTLYCQLPFVIGYHPGPTDFWRFTREGIVELVERSGLHCEEVGICVGPAFGFYRIAVEFVATLFELIFSPLYMPAKIGFAVLLYPIKWLDPAMRRSGQVDRVTGGYFVIARKVRIEEA
jgi:SAM-dependent methyltransferase